MFNLMRYVPSGSCFSARISALQLQCRDSHPVSLLYNYSINPLELKEPNAVALNANCDKRNPRYSIHLTQLDTTHANCAPTSQDVFV